MTRRVLLRPGVPTTDKRLLAPEGVTWREEPLPVMAKAGDQATIVIGRVDSIRREPNGDITGDITLILPDTLFPEADMDNVFFDKDNSHDDDGNLVIREARLTAVTLGTGPVWEPETMGQVDD